MTANHDDIIDGIIVYYPIFNDRQDQYLQQITDVSKDVEGLSHQYIFNLYQNNRFLDEEKVQKSVLPCTPLAVIKILEYLRIYNTILPYGNRLFGHSITVVNRSEVVGRPLAALLANDGACVYSVDLNGVQQFTRGEGIRKKRHEVVEKEGWGLQDCVPLSDVVISGVPGDSFKFPTEFLRDGAVCINFSTEKVRSFILDKQKLLSMLRSWACVRWLSNDLLSPWLPHASSLRAIIFSSPGNRICEWYIGLVKLSNLQNFGPAVKEKASIYVPAIGKVTIIVLLRNLVV